MSFILTNKKINTVINTFQEHVDSLKLKMKKKYLNLNVKKMVGQFFLNVKTRPVNPLVKKLKKHITTNMLK